MAARFVIAILVELALGQHEPFLRGRSKATWAAFVINLERRPARLASFRDTVREQQPWILQKLHTITGVDGQMLLGNASFQENLVETGRISRTHLERALKPGMGPRWPRLTPGGVGLFLSHAQVWKQISKSNLDYGVVFEDDLAYFTAEFENKVRSGILENASFQDDFVYLQECSQASAWPRSSSMETTYTILHAEQVVPCTAAYIMSKKAAGLLLTNAFPMSAQLDRALSGAVVGGLRRASYSPSVAQVGNHSLLSDVQLPGSGILLSFMTTHSSADTTYTTTYLGFSGASSCASSSLTPREQQCLQDQVAARSGSSGSSGAGLEYMLQTAGRRCSEKDSAALRDHVAGLQDISCSCADAMLDVTESFIKDCYLSITLSCVCQKRHFLAWNGGRGSSCPILRTC